MQIHWIYTVCKGRVYPVSVGQGLIYSFGRKYYISNLPNRGSVKDEDPSFMRMALLRGAASGDFKRGRRTRHRSFMYRHVEELFPSIKACKS